MKKNLLIFTAVLVLGFSTTAFADCRDGEINHGTRQCEEPNNSEGETGHGNFFDGEVGHGTLVDGELNHGNLWDYFLTIFGK